MRLAIVLSSLILLAACGTDTADAPGDGSDAAVNQTTAEARPASADRDEAEPITIVYLGDSLTAGFGLPRGPEQAYPALLEERFESLGINVRTVNAGISGDTSAGGRSRLNWYLDRFDVDVLVVALGANDGLRGLPINNLRQNLETIIDRAREAQPDIEIVLAGMLVPVSYGGDYFRQFDELYPAIAEDRDVALIPFLLEGVAGIREMNQADGVHPTARGQQVMADTVWEYLRPVVERVSRQRS